MIKLEDSNLTISQAQQGYYKVGDKFYNNKFNALLEATHTKQTVTWDFNSIQYQEQLRKPRMNVPLPMLYAERAKQLREKYDYLILAFSGGADSDDILKTFTNNNIKLDEVWTDWNHTFIEKSKYVLSKRKDPSNMPSEWFYVIKPELDKLRITNPEIKIHVSDANSSLHDEDLGDTITVLSGYLSWVSVKRYRYLRNYVRELGKTMRVGIITGIDKVVPVIKDNEYGFVFTDNAVVVKRDGVDFGDMVIEYFYWTGDMPALAVEQSYRVWDYLLQNPSFTLERMKIQLARDKSWMDRDKTFDQVIKQICYPYWDFSKHQVNRSLLYNNKHFSYVDKFKNERFYQSGTSHMENCLTALDKTLALDPRYPGLNELKPYYNYYTVGKLPELNI